VVLGGERDVNMESIKDERSLTFQGHRVLPDGLNSILRDDSLTAFEHWRDADFFPLYGDLCEKSLNRARAGDLGDILLRQYRSFLQIH
jgi:hypothetical protein